MLLCLREGGCLPDKRKFCPDCNLTCNSEECYQYHKSDSARAKSKCSKRKKCLKCRKVVNLDKQDFADHICHQYRCRTCQKFVDSTHLCFLRRKKPGVENPSLFFLTWNLLKQNFYNAKMGMSLIQETQIVRNAQNIKHVKSV